MQTVVETPPYLAQAKQAGLGADDLARIVTLLAQEPKAGVVMVGTGGCRKLRVAREGSGKSGGVRVISFFGGGYMPVFLLAVFGKGQKDNLSRSECNALARLTGRLAEAYASGKVKR